MTTIKMLLATTSLLAIAACAPARLYTVTDEYGRQLSIVDTGSDEAGGKRMAVIGQFRRDNLFIPHAVADGPGTFQTTLPALIQGAAFAGGSIGAAAALRPSSYTDNTSVSQSGASIASGAVGGTNITSTNGPTSVSGYSTSKSDGSSAVAGGGSVGAITSTGVGGTGGTGYGGQSSASSTALGGGMGGGQGNR